MEKENAKPKVKETRSLWKELFEWVDLIVLTGIVMLLIFTFVFRNIEIDGGSMNNTLIHGERVIISNLFYTPKNGDIVVVSSEVYDDIPIIKRVIATEGQWIDIRNGLVYVGDSEDDMQLLEEDYIGGQYTEDIIASNFYGHHTYPLQVPENKLFLLGDNRSVSLDSRTTVVGLVDERQVLGKALYRVYPLDKMGSVY
ncbi:MAG: signal peptidase I [Ruminococcaceae bacterium]|nr:signal peptidase I [Oscillospiraceae bacterium]